jgi:FkbM family methyltransferase
MSKVSRALLSAAGKLGLRSARLADGSAVLTRGKEPLVHPLTAGTNVVSVSERADVKDVAPGSWLVQVPPRPRNPLRLLRLDETSWILQRKNSRRMAQRIGPKRLRADIVRDEKTVRSNGRLFQKALASYAAHEHIGWMLRELNVNCVLDVGANEGQYGQRLREAGYAGRIVSFEPLEVHVAPLRERAAADHDWKVFACALGDSDGEADINVAPGKVSSLLPSSEFGRDWSDNLRDTHPETISIRRLDGLLDEATEGIQDPRIYLKLDTQGYDLPAFAGAGQRIQEVVGMQSEVSCVPIYEGMPRMHEQIPVYESQGFEITGMFPVSLDRSSLRVIEFDVVMIRVSALSGRSSDPATDEAVSS